MHIQYTSIGMKRLSLVWFAVMAGFFLNGLQAQNKFIKNGDRLYEHMVFPGAAREYERGLAKQRELAPMERLADCYVQLSDLKKAEYWYGEVVKMKGASPVNKFRYGQVLKANGKYAEARQWFDAYLQTGENPSLAARMVQSCDFAVEARKDSSRYKITPEPVNSHRSEFGPAMYQQGYLIVGERRYAGNKVVNLRNNNSFYDMFYAERSPKAKSGVKLTKLKGKVNKKHHDGPATVNKDQTMLYFTRSVYVHDRKGKSPVNHSKLRILSAEYIKGKWKNLQEMPFNSENYSVGHPTLSADGNAIVFASDIPGGFGGTDLYISYRDGKSWGTPQNLGSSINTEGDEQFPYLHPSGALFFASDGHTGLGGLDIFSASKNGEKWGEAVNAGYGINSAADDFSICWVNGKSMGYFASNRSGDDHIYQFKRQMKVDGVIVDKRSGKPIEGAAVTLTDASGQESKYTTNAKGEFSHMAEWGKEYLVTANKPDYLQIRERVSTADVNPMQDVRKQFSMEHDLVLSVSGLVTDAATGTALPGAKVRLIANTERSVETDKQGNYYSVVDGEKEYAVVIMKPGYVPQVFHFSTEGKKSSEDFKFNAPLVKGAFALVEGRTVETESRLPIPAANVRTIDMHFGQEVKAAITRKDGRFWQVVDPRSEPTLIASKVGYFSSRLELTGVDSNTVDTTITVDLPMVRYEVGALVKVIYYDYNKSDIKKNASKDLLEIVYFLQDNPEASIQLSSFTDARGGDDYNQALSQRRADAAVGYIVSKGVAPTRLAAKGYGEADIVNKCKNDVECSEEEHSANRRTEIRITKLQ